MKYSNGGTYDGNWVNDIRDGKGKCFLSIGILIDSIGKYDGLWKNDKKNGYGMKRIM